MTIAIAALFVWCLFLTFALTAVTARAAELAELTVKAWKQQQALNEQYDHDITKLEDRTR